MHVVEGDWVADRDFSQAKLDMNAAEYFDAHYVFDTQCEYVFILRGVDYAERQKKRSSHYECV